MKSIMDGMIHHDEMILDGMVQADCLVDYEMIHIFVYDAISYLKCVIKLMSDLILLIIIFLYL
jgi:hypothetical protein